MSSGPARHIAIGAGALALATPAAGQGLTPWRPLKWAVLENQHSHSNADDEGLGIASWAITTYAGEPYITGAQGGSTFDRMMALSYYEDPPDYLHNWDRIFNGPYIGATSNEGRGIVVADADGARSVYVVGVSTESGEGRQFTTWRFLED